jgi:hypothetical protein
MGIKKITNKISGDKKGDKIRKNTINKSWR